MKKIFNAVCMAAILVFASSCIKDRQSDEGITGKPGDAEVILRLKTPGGFSAPGSRALTNEDENTINDIYVLVFDKTNTLVAIKQGEEVAYTVGSGDPLYSGTGSFSVTLEASKTTVDTYNLVVLANAETILSNTIGQNVSAIGDKGYSAVTSRIRASITGAMYASGGTIPMWGESGQTVIEPGGNNRTLTLTRSVARIDAGVGRAAKNSDTDAWSWDGRDAGGNTIPFTLTEVYIIRPNDRYAVIPDAALAAGSPTVPAGTAAFTVAASESAFAFAATVSAAGGFTSRDIYVPEADILMGASGKPGDINHENRMAVVVGGSYNGGGTTYYRLDFAKDGGLMNVLRNHLYQFNISGVSGAGYPDVETAYKSLAMNMTVDILEWNETDIGEIVFDGQFYLSVSQGEFEFTREARDASDSDNRLIVQTDVRSGWQATIWDDLAGTTTLSNDQTTGNPWLRMSTTQSLSTDRITVVLSMDANTGSMERTAYILIKAGRLIYKVKVVQTLESNFAITITDINGYPISELSFDPYIGQSSVPSQIINLKWGPPNLVYTVQGATIGANPFDFGTGDDPLTISPEDGGFKSFLIQPSPITEAEIDPDQGGDVFLSKITKIDFMIFNGISYKSASIYMRQTAYNLVPDIMPATYTYGMNGDSYSFNFSTNTEWIAEFSGDLSMFASSTETRSGGIGMNQPFEFSLITSTEPQKTAYVTFSSPQNKFAPVTITILANPAYLRLAPTTYSVPYYLATTIYIDVDTNLPLDVLNTPTITNNGNGIITAVALDKQNRRLTVNVAVAQSTARTGTVQITYGSNQLVATANISRLANPYTLINGVWYGPWFNLEMSQMATLDPSYGCIAGATRPSSQSEAYNIAIQKNTGEITYYGASSDSYGGTWGYAWNSYMGAGWQWAYCGSGNVHSTRCILRQ